MTEFRIRGEAWLTVDTVAACYRCEVSWIEEVCRMGLLGSAELIEGRMVVRTVMLDRVADIVRLHHHQGVELEIIAALLEWKE